MASGAAHASLRAALLPLVAVDDALIKRARAAPSRLRTGDALAFAMDVQRAAMGPRFAVDDDTLARNIALVQRAAFAHHDEPARAHLVTREVDAALVDGAGSRVARRFAWRTAFVATELAIVHMLEALTDITMLRRVRDDVDARARFVHESLRVQSPVARFGRVATEGVIIAAVHVPRGARVLLSFAAANHDPRVFARPRAVDVDRLRAPTFAFGAGAHACVGAPVAIAILRAVLDVVVAGRVECVSRTPLVSHVNRGARACSIRVRW